MNKEWRSWRWKSSSNNTTRFFQQESHQNGSIAHIWELQFRDNKRTRAGYLELVERDTWCYIIAKVEKKKKWDGMEFMRIMTINSITYSILYYGRSHSAPDIFNEKGKYHLHSSLLHFSFIILIHTYIHSHLQLSQEDEELTEWEQELRWGEWKDYQVFWHFAA